MTEAELNAVEERARACDETHQECCGAAAGVPEVVAEARRLRATALLTAAAVQRAYGIEAGRIVRRAFELPDPVEPKSEHPDPMGLPKFPGS